MFKIGDKVKFDRIKSPSLHDVFGDQVFTIDDIKFRISSSYQRLEIAVISCESIKDLDIQNPHRFLSIVTDSNKNLVFSFY